MCCNVILENHCFHIFILSLNDLYAERFSSSVEYKDDGEKWICCPEEQPFDEIR